MTFNPDWTREGKEMGATHIVVVCDTFDWDDFPVFVMPGENLEEIRAKHDGVNMEKIMEVINLDKEADNEGA